MSKDYYNILGVSKESSDDEIKRAYRKLAHKHHPDKQGGDEAKFKEINEAYQVLSDKKKRQQYDQFGQTFEQAQSQGQGGFSGFEGFRDFSSFANGFGFDFGSNRTNGGGFEDIFSDIFGAAGFSGRSGATQRQPVGSDIEMDTEITFEEMAKGTEKEFDVYKKIICDKCGGTGAEGKETKTCPTCQGSGKVQRAARSIFGTFTQVTACPECQGKGNIPKTKCKKCGGDGVVRDYQRVKINIPAGIENGQTVRIEGYGEAPNGGGRSGDLYLTIHVKPHGRFVRKGVNVQSKETISFSQAILGDKISVETIDGPIKMKIPQGIQSGTYLKIRGKGISRMRGFGRGDHLIEIFVRTPEKLSYRQKELIKQLKEEGL
jgi:molecular chaperone DnaJ